MTKQELLNMAYEEQYDLGMTQREFDCLIALIEDGTISTLQELNDYGVGL